MYLFSHLPPLPIWLFHMAPGIQLNPLFRFMLRLSDWNQNLRVTLGFCLPLPVSHLVCPECLSHRLDLLLPWQHGPVHPSHGPSALSSPGSMRTASELLRKHWNEWISGQMNEWMASEIVWGHFHLGWCLFFFFFFFFYWHETLFCLPALTFWNCILRRDFYHVIPLSALTHMYINFKGGIIYGIYGILLHLGIISVVSCVRLCSCYSWEIFPINGRNNWSARPSLN